MEDPAYPSVLLDDTCYEDEAILPQPAKAACDLPPLLARARALANENFPASRQEIFLRQGLLLAEYEDDSPYAGDPVRYYPTYQSLTDQELRGYFTWRPKVRARQVEPAPLTFLFLHIYELINCIGVGDAEEAYDELLFIRRTYAGLGWNVSSYLDRWLTDFVIYYDLPREILAESSEKLHDQCVNILANIDRQPQDRVMDAVKQLAPRWLARSRFYAAHFEDMDTVTYKVLKGMAAHYAASCKRSLVDQLFGARIPRHMHIFSQAIFCNPLRRQNYRYAVDDQCVYTCENGIWTSNRRPFSARSGRKLESLLKTIDHLMREQYSFGHPIRGEISTRWILRLIEETTRDLLENKAAAEKSRIRIDFGILDKIRADAAITRERLVTEEDAEETETPLRTPAAAPSTAPGAGDGARAADTLLAGPEARLLRCLIHGGETDWVSREGHMRSVLVDAINEKLYDAFGDTVLDDAGEPVPDYISDLKEMFPR